MSDSDTRLDALEIALTHHAAALDDLDAVVREQVDRIDRLQRLVARLADRQTELEAPAGAPPDPDARPPHW